MFLYVSEFTDLGLKSITLVSPTGEAMTWDSRTYTRASRITGTNAPIRPEDDMVFREINAYWATLPVERQQLIWAAYQDIFQLFETNFDPLALQSRLQKAIQKIYDQMPYAELHEWAQMSSMIVIPPSFKAQYGENDPIKLTYLRQDYFDLAVLAIALRPMVPIWGEYIPRIKDTIENTFKEYTAVKLMYRTYVTSCVPYRRLWDYMEASIENKAKPGNMLSALLSGLASSDIPDWLLANTLVRRTSVVPIASESNGPNIVTDVYQYVNNTLRSPGNRRFSGSISPKTVRKDDKADQQESLAESYKIKQEVPDGDVVMANAYLTESVTMARSIDPTIDLSLLEQCLAAAEPLENQQILPHQLTLTQWVLVSVLAMGYIPLLNKPSLLRGMAVAQALLWHWGFYDLAALVTARELKQQDDEFVSAQETRSKIPKELMEEMEAIYPNGYQVKGKNVTPKQTNPGSRSVDAFYTLIANSDWYLYAPPNLLKLTGRVGASRKMYVPTDIRVQLARLLIHLYHQRLAFAERSHMAPYPIR